MSFLKRWRSTIAYVVLAVAVAYALWAVTGLANRFDRDAYSRSVSIRQSQLDGCERTNELRARLNLKHIDCASKYPALRK